MVSRRIGAKVGVVAGIGAVVSAFGVVTPAQAYTCDATIDPTEAALRAAIGNGDTVICINPGTLDMGNGGSNTDNVPIVIDSDLTLVGLGDVTVDGSFDTSGFIVGAGDGEVVDIDIVIDNLEIINFQEFDFGDLDSAANEKIVPVVGLSRSATGTVTVLNSRFENNNSYIAIVGAVDQDNWSTFGTITIDNTVFESNASNWGTVWGYSDMTVTDSTFVENYGFNVSSAIEQWSSDDTWDDSTAIISGNLFDANTGSESTVYLDSAGGSVYNNTFAWNYSSSDTYGSAIATSSDASFAVAYNTFYENDSDYDVANVTADTATELVMTGNVFSTLVDEIGVSVNENTVSDRGGNFSTADDSAAFDHEKSQVTVDVADLKLGEPADNGGSTWTAALGAGSIAMNVMSMTDVANELGPDLAWDQRGEARGSLVDSGAWDDGNDGQLAETGVDATGLALTSGLLGAAGVAFVTRRRTT